MAKFMRPRQERKEEANLDYGDELLHCLEMITGLLDHQISTSSLKAGLPLGPSGFGPDLLMRAAERFDFKTKFITRSLGDISSLTLPCIHLLKHRHACILAKIRKGMATVCFPGKSREFVVIPLAELKKLYSGKAILITYKPFLGTTPVC